MAAPARRVSIDRTNADRIMCILATSTRRAFPYAPDRRRLAPPAAIRHPLAGVGGVVGHVAYLYAHAASSIPKATQRHRGVSILAQVRPRCEPVRATCRQSQNAAAVRRARMHPIGWALNDC